MNNKTIETVINSNLSNSNRKENIMENNKTAVILAVNINKENNMENDKLPEPPFEIILHLKYGFEENKKMKTRHYKMHVKMYNKFRNAFDSAVNLLNKFDLNYTAKFEKNENVINVYMTIEEDGLAFLNSIEEWDCSEYLVLTPAFLGWFERYKNAYSFIIHSEKYIPPFEFQRFNGMYEMLKEHWNEQPIHPDWIWAEIEQMKSDIEWIKFDK